MPTSNGTPMARERAQARISDQGKMAPSDANYRTPAEDPSKACAACEFFLNDPQDGHSKCAKVAGAIAPEATCDLFQASGGAAPPLTDQMATPLSPTPPPMMGPPPQMGPM